jgi:PadR family transcriptional regulator PadR
LDTAYPVDRKFQKELNAGSAALVLLSVVRRASEPLYGYQIAKRLSSVGKAGTPMKQGALYPVLRSLEKMGLLRSEVQPSVAAPPRRYYRITEDGCEALDRWETIWHESKTFVDSILKGSGDV